MATSLLFTILFICGTAVVYYIVPLQLRWIVLLVASTGFYIAIEPHLFVIAILSALWTWWITRSISISPRKSYLAVGIVPVILSLFVFKYYNFFCHSAAQFLEKLGIMLDPAVLKLAMPIGISYYTFKLIAYQVDVFKKKYTCEPNPGKFLTYALFFPQIVCGPIQRPNQFLDQFKNTTRFNVHLFDCGIRLIILGLFKILVIANQIQPYVNQVYSRFESTSGLALLCNAFFYSILIYCDFSGCSDIAIGSGNLLGIQCPRNFNAPYFSQNIHEFWKRWHISLTSWLRDYIYIPLGGNRVSKPRQKLNVLITFLTSGLWHGANWTFIFWGLMHGIWTILSPRPPKIKADEDTGTTKSPGRWSVAKAILSTIGTCFGVTIAWIFFRSENISAAFRYIWRMFTQLRISAQAIQDAVLPFSGDNTSIYIFLTLIMCLIVFGIFEKKIISNPKYDDKPLPAAWIVTFLVLTILFGKFGQSSFIYANF